MMLATPVPPLVAADTPLQPQLQRLVMEALEQMMEDEAE
jgi:hypothetical protein